MKLRKVVLFDSNAVYIDPEEIICVYEDFSVGMRSTCITMRCGKEFNLSYPIDKFIEDLEKIEKV